MIYTKSTTRLAVHGDADSYERKVNELLTELANRGIAEIDIHEVIDPSVKDAFACTLTYEESYNIPETLADRKRIAGAKDTCADCPHFEQEDKRKKKGLCTFMDVEVEKSTFACDHYYLLTDMDDI